jgi:serine/threonine protein kinase
MRATTPGTVLVSARGTPAWHPPEVRALGKAERELVSTPMADVFALGLMLLCMLAGVLPDDLAEGTLPVRGAGQGMVCCLLLLCVCPVSSSGAAMWCVHVR